MDGTNEEEPLVEEELIEEEEFMEEEEEEEVEVEEEEEVEVEDEEEEVEVEDEEEEVEVEDEEEEVEVEDEEEEVEVVEEEEVVLEEEEEVELEEEEEEEEVKVEEEEDLDEKRIEEEDLEEKVDDEGLEDTIEELDEESVSKPNEDPIESEYKIEYILNSSNEKKTSVNEATSECTPLQTHPRKKSKQEQYSNSTSEKNGVGSTDLGSCSGVSKAVIDRPTSAEKEGTGSSGKRRRSRWNADAEGDNEPDQCDDRISKRRKTRWDVDDSQLKMLGPIQLPDFMKNFLDESNLDSDFQWLKERLIELNKLLKCSDIHNENFVEAISIKLRNKLVRERQTVISKLIKKNSLFEIPKVCEPPKLFKKLYVPVKEFPEYNFIGVIIGPRGNALKKMEAESGARIFLRGKGSSLKQTDNPSDNEDLHVLIEANNQKSVDTAVEMVEKLLNPFNEGWIDHKYEQLKELSNLNNKAKNQCKSCLEVGHMQYACPKSQSTFSKFTDPGFDLGSTPKPNKEINEANLYVGHLPQDVSEVRLSEIFCRFGKLKEVKVINDHTTGLSKGYGFVEFENSSDAAVAVKHTNGLKMDGKILAVNVAGRPPLPVLSLVSHLPLYPGPILLPQAVHGPSFSSPAVAFSGMPSQTSNFLFHSQPSINSSYLHPDKFQFVSPIPQLPDNVDYSSSEFKSYSATPPVIRPSLSFLAQFPGDPDYPGSQFL